MKQEIEIKIAITKKEFQHFTKHLDNCQLERTFGFFKDDYSNIEEGVFPRLKHIIGQKSSIVFTVKTKLQTKSKLFRRQEMEITLDDVTQLDELRSIIRALGFSKEIIFEKKRFCVTKENIVITFDELPFGFFVELEGEPPVIIKYQQELNLTEHQIINRAYLALWEEYCQVHKIKQTDCVFVKKSAKNSLVS